MNPLFFFFFILSLSIICWTTTTCHGFRVGILPTTATTRTTMKLWAGRGGGGSSGNSNRAGTRTTSTAESSSSSSSSSTTLLARMLPKLKPHHKRIYLIRHGQTNWNLEGRMQGGGYDLELNENGLDQATRLGNELSQIAQLQTIVASPLKRAIQTSLHINNNNNNKGHGDDDGNDSTTRLVDRRFGEMRFGDFEGTIIKGNNASPADQRRYNSMLKKMRHNVHLKWPGDPRGESTYEVSQRGMDALMNLIDSRYGEEENHLAIVAHGRFNKILLATILYDGDCSRYGEIQQDNTCINVLDYNTFDDTFEPIVINYVAGYHHDVQSQQHQQQTAGGTSRTSLPPTSLMHSFNSTFSSKTNFTMAP